MRAGLRLPWVFHLLIAACLLGSIEESKAFADLKFRPAKRPLIEVLEEISEKFKVFFTYDAELLKDIEVEFDLSDIDDLEEAVSSLLQQTGLGYEHLGGKYYVIYKDDRRGMKTMKKIKRKIQQIQKLEQTGSLSLQKQGRGEPAKDLHDIAHTAHRLNAVKSFSGEVSDADGNPLIGANVLVKGAIVGTVTDENGHYTIDVPLASNVLIFSYIGFETREITLDQGKELNVVLKTAANQLSEVVVTGYGLQPRETLSGAVASVDMAQVEAVPLTSVEQILQGRVSGVQVIQTGGGAPGGAVQVNIRGVGTINGETPLYVIDGIPVQEGGQNDQGYSFLNNLSPNDIASIDILKDATAAAIYGSRASGGVILITTKRGREGPVAVSWEAYYGNQYRGDTYEVLNADQYTNYLQELHNQPDGDLPTAFTNGATPRNVDTDWQKALFQATAPIQNYNLGISGGSKTAAFSLGFGYFDQDGIMIGSRFSRYSLRANADFTIGKKIKIGETLLLSRTVRGTIRNSGGRRAQEHALKQSPFVPIDDDTFLGGFAHPDVDEGQDARNPVADQFIYDDEQERYRLWASVYSEVELFRGLTYKLQLGLDLGYQDEFKYNPEFQSVRRLTERSSISRKRSQQLNPLLEQYLTYERQADRHYISLMGGFSAQSFTFSQVGGSGEDLPPGVFSLDGATANVLVFDERIETALRSVFGRLQYNFDGKYLLTANIRRDESSKLFRGVKNGIFPSASLGWNISKERFLKHHPVINELKFRLGYGEVGNQSPLGAHPADVALQTDYYYVIGNQTVQGINQHTLANADISWETSRQLNIGLDGQLWANRIHFNVDYYRKHTLDLIWPQPVPASVGLGPAYVNAGEIRNQGVELGLTYYKQHGNFTFDVNANLTTIDNRVISLVNDDLIIKTGNPTDDLTGVSWTQVGQPIGTFYGYVSDGIFRSWEEVYDHAYINQAITGNANDVGVPVYDTGRRDAETATAHTAPGDIKWRDVNGDGIVNAEDQVPLGSPIPKLIYGFSFNAAYKGFDFQLFLQGAAGNKIFNVARRWLSDNRQNFNVGAEALNATSYRENYTASEPRLVRADPNKNILRSSDRYVYDGSYLRVKNLTIGYRFGETALRGIGAGRFRLYVTAQNLFTFTRYFGLEPEVGSFSSGTSLDAGIDRLIYPQPRSMIFGVQIEF